MWGGLGDPGGPGGSSQDPPVNQELLDLKDQTEQQQALIAGLKEIIKQEHMVINKEKVDEYANTLTRINERVKKSKSNKQDVTVRNTQIDIPQRDKINLLKQQVETNKAILAERVKSQKGIEDMFTQIKAQFDDSQHLIQQTSQVLVTDKSIDNYSSQSSSEELYNFLVLKEKHITELNNKIQKLEANVLDLQENVKEKDSVIDARTKAITLMSENLSKKGKNTLDELDDTKEQMRKMQENFVAFETQMKMDKQKLKIDLEEKCNELFIMQTCNQKLTEDVEELQQKLSHVHKTTEDDGINALQATIKQNDFERQEYLSRIEELESKISDLTATITELKAHVCVSEATATDGEDIVKLKKQLDESNKNMIKTKAQHKSKLKELNKKLDDFKKISDVNAELVKLEAENSRANMKIVELEEEKGNLQLKINEMSNIQDTIEELETLRTTLQEKNEATANAESTISNLTKNLDETRQKINELEDTISTLSQLQNDKIKSEISSIDYEEKLDTLHKENVILLKEISELNEEKEKLMVEIETLKKDKQELNQKLDSYMQENMELIDKLEKLSAEKVSSAESIEIVENLTQQEKLEIEAYQKRLDFPSGSIKNSNENLAAQDLNESVTQLTEETAELLQKIELFTVERREVMEKMDLLSQENSQLNMKIKEVEINRDMLAETYEHLQNEKELLDNKLEELNKQNKELVNASEKAKNVEDQEKQHDLTNKLNNDLLNLQTQFNSLLSENEALKYELQSGNDTETIANYRIIIEENKNELISSANYINELQNEIERKKKEIVENEESYTKLKNQLDNLNNEHSNASNNDKMESLMVELQAVKDLMDETVKNTEIYKRELDTSTETIQNLNKELNSVNGVVDELEESLAIKDIELNKLSTDLKEKNGQIVHLEELLQTKEREIQEVVNQFKGKYEKLQVQIESNSGSIENIKTPLQTKINELETKNKEQLEKMKKYAVTLKKKTTMLQELETKFEDVNKKFENECKEKKELQNRLNKAIEQENKLKMTFTQLNELQEELLEMQIKYERLQNDFDSRIIDYNKLNEEFEAYKLRASNELELTKGTNTELINKMNNLELTIRQYEEQKQNYQQESLQKSTDVDHIAELTRELNELRFESDKKKSTLEMKINELEIYIENQETELNSYKEKVNRLIEGLGAVEKRRLSLENKAIQLGMKLEENVQQSFDSSFDDFEERFKALKSHDELIERQLQESHKEYNDLMERHHNVVDENENIKIQLNHTMEKYNEINTDYERLKLLEEEYNQQIDVIRNLENQLKVTQNSSNEKLNELESYCEKIEVDFQQQQEDLYQEKKQLNEQNEKLLEELTLLKQTLESQQKELADKEEELQKLININRSHETSLADMNETLLEFQNRRQQLENQLSHYKATVDDLGSQKTKSDEWIKALQEENKQLQVKLDETKLEIESSNNTKKSAEGSAQGNVPIPMDDAFGTEPNQTPIAKFTWPGDEIDDPFAFVSVPETTSQQLEGAPSSGEQVKEPSATTEKDIEELQKKIKTLEFMLFNVEKEKDDAVMQCSELSNELTRLIYDKQQTGASPNLEAQIVSAAETIFSAENRKELKKIEYERCAFDPKAVASSSEAGVPVAEEMIKPKTAYLCHDEDTPSVKTDSAKETFFDEEDGWGFATADIPVTSKSTLEEYQQSFDELNEKVRVLEMERENHLEEIKQCQIKSGKLIRKLKEFKQLNEQLSAKLKDKKSESAFSDLDDAIQDEMKNQINGLEKKLKEYENETRKDKQERENLNNRIDVLTAANEKLIESKERQDIEIISWQRQTRELQQKLEQMEWGSDEQSAKGSPTKNKTSSTAETTEELNSIIKDLTLDNEELQALLEEQRALRLEAERKKTMVVESKELEEKYASILQEKNSLQDQVQSLMRNQEHLEKQFEELQKKYDCLYKEFEEVNSELTAADEKINLYDQLKEEHKNVKDAHDELMLAYERIKTEFETHKKENEENREGINEMLKQQLEEKCHHVSDLIRKVEHLEQQLTEEINKNKLLSEEIGNLHQSAQLTTDFSGEKQGLLMQISEKDNLVESLTADKNRLENELAQLRDAVELKNNETQELREKMVTQMDDEYNMKLTITVEDLNRQWAQRVDERGADVAESWKLHLESRENEFMQIEQRLRKELNELEEKCNALVNENNELRKNVDAEIRNEVDKISALQQQINDRNKQINDLTLVLQEKQQLIEQQQFMLDEKEMHVQNILTQKLKEKDVIVTGLENSVTMLQEEVAKLKEIIKRQEEELGSKENQLSSKQDEFQDISMELDRRHVENEKLQLEHKKLETQLQELNRQTEEFEIARTELVTMRQELQNVRKEYENVQNELGVALKEISHKEEDLIIKNKQIHQQNEEIQNNQALIQSLQNALENRSDGTTNLQFELNEYKDKVADLESSIANKAKCIDESQLMLEQFQQQLIDYNKSYSTLEQQINEKDMYIMQMNFRLQELEANQQQNQAQIQQLEQLKEQHLADIANYKTQLEEIDNHRLQTDNEAFVQKNQEIAQLKLLLDEKEKEYGYNLQEQHNLASHAMANNQQQIEALKRQMLEYETRQEETLSLKLAEIDSLQAQLDDANSKLAYVMQQNEVYEKVAQELREKTIQCDDLTLKVNEQNILHEEEGKQLIEMREIVEEQTKNIEQLKAELYQKSNDFDSLVSQISMSDGQSATTLKTKSTVDDGDEKPLQSADRAELELAQYMLYQRDVRCEELTVELMQLLEERDTLQLRLSNAIKEKEELRSKCETMRTVTPTEDPHAEDANDGGRSRGAIPKSKAIVLGATGTELAVEATERNASKSVDELANKLSELKTIGYKKDKNIVDEQEYRRLQELSILQNHRDDVSKLPAEAAARLVDASYTLSRDVQSPSKVLLNWLWGRSTPKVNEL